MNRVKSENLRKLKQRKLLSELIKWLDTDKIILIKGARQVGKTSLMYLLIKHLLSHEVPEDRIHFYDLEDEIIRVSFEGSYRDVMSFLQAEGVNDRNLHYIFLDALFVEI